MKVTEHVTGLGEILFMAAAKPIVNKSTQKPEYSIKVKLADNDNAIKHLSEVADYKVDTKTNRALEGTGHKVVTFTTNYAPVVLDSEGEILEVEDIPFFNGRVDTGNAVVSYRLIDYGDNQIIRLSGIKLQELNLAPREDTGQSVDVTLEMLKNIN